MFKFQEKSIQKLFGLPRLVKRLIVLALDASLCITTVWLAFYLRLGEFVQLYDNKIWLVFFSLLTALPIFVVFGLYREIFRYTGWSAILSVSRALLCYSVIFAGVVTTFGIPGVPRTIGLIQPLLLLFAVAGSRLIFKYCFVGPQRFVKFNKQLRVLVYGAGVAGRQLASALKNGNEMQVAGFLDDDEKLHKQVLNGIKIYSPEELSEIVVTRQITHVILAIPSVNRRRRNEILKQIERCPVSVRTLPGMMDLAEGRVTVSDLRDLDIDDLLARDCVTPNHALLEKNITKKTVMVTGAGGSIGSEICRQVLKLKPARLLLIEFNEFALYTIYNELEAVQAGQEKINSVTLLPLLSSVQEEERMRQIMDTWNPDTLYHAAAYKHVPLVEHNLAEGVKNNVMGTLTAARVAIEKGVSDFVLISTDKAVRPTNAMGASKRLAEICIQALFENQSNDIQAHIKTKLSMVRFGNVLGSSGSVIPLFRKQIKNGGPITVTHPEITRYFMTIPEAAQLVIQAGAMAEGGDVFVLDMGEPVRIVDLARRMVELSGLSVRDELNSDDDIDIIYSGLRPGEKLYEELLIGENPKLTLHPKILKAQDEFISWGQLESELETLKEHILDNEVQLIVLCLKRLINDYQPSSKVVDWIFCKKSVS